MWNVRSGEGRKHQRSRDEERGLGKRKGEEDVAKHSSAVSAVSLHYLIYPRKKKIT